MGDHRASIKIEMTFHGKSVLEMPVWINKPETWWQRWKFKVTGKPAPKYKSIIQLHKELNNHINDHVEIMEVLPPYDDEAEKVFCNKIAAEMSREMYSNRRQNDIRIRERNKASRTNP